MNAWDHSTKRKGFGRILYYGGEYWGEPDAQRAALLSQGSDQATARIVETVIENTPLGLMSDQDGGTWGAARFSGGSQTKLFQALSQAPEMPARFKKVFASPPTSNPIKSSLLREGWYTIAREPWAQKIYWQIWFEKFVDPAWSKMQALGWKSERALAALVRLRNSAPAKMARGVEAARRAGGSEEHQIDALLNQYASEKDDPATPELDGLYAERAEELRREHPLTPLTHKPSPEDLYLDAPLTRPGTALPTTTKKKSKAGLGLLALGALGLIIWRINKK